MQIVASNAVGISSAETTMAVRRIVIGDDSPVFIASARRHLALARDLVVAGSAGSASGIVEQITLLQPDLLLLSINLPGLGGLALVRRIKALAHAPVVVILALDNLEDYRIAALEAGADGFLAKTEFVAEAIPLLRALLAPAGDPWPDRC